ncbi:permease [Longimonas halophila]|uniref:Permease n=1 Tax=Longimonas halophila TaxID=1469170 RepID=A0A2H3NLW5_9BACT|nr:FtsX-like permease family protein [Longimonas halophila]PEN07608.1 permease [Longimonas halophila]
MNRFTLSMAWRDSRGSRARLVLYLSALVVGVAVLVAINGFGDNLTRTIDNESRQLLGADFALERENAFPDSIRAVADSVGGTQAKRISFASMVAFSGEDGGTRLSTIRATQPGYPFYGTVQTTPAGRYDGFAERGEALVDATLWNAFSLSEGDSIRVGRNWYPVAGRVDQMPNEAGIASSFSPRVYVPYAGLDTTLLGRGSRAEHELYFQFDDSRDIEALVSSIRPAMEAAEVDIDTVEEAAGNWREGLGNLYRFLSLVGFMALILGCIGIASAMHVYIQQRLTSVAVLRCLGAKSGQTFRIYLTQAAALGLLGGGLGTALGVAMQVAVPAVLADFLPVPVSFTVSWRAVGLGLGLGTIATILFALIPLLPVRRVSPLQALRQQVEGAEGRDWLRWALGGVIGAALTGFAVVQAPTWQIGLGYAGGLLVVFAALAGLARGLMRVLRRAVPSSWSYPLRQGLANLHRPHNQTTVLLVALGLGSFLIATLLVSQETILSQIRLTGDAEDRPNMVLFDVQPDQVRGVANTIEEAGAPVLDEEPIVTMRLSAVNGRSVEALREDPDVRTTWAHRREYRSTYRDHLTESETIVEGTFVRERFEGEGPAPISLETDIAEELNVAIGDELTFDVQGVPMTTEVRSLRRVDWQRIGTNFFVVFPPGVLEDAPQIYAMLSRTESSDQAASVQNAVVSAFPNVSIIDLTLVLRTAQDLFSKLGYVIRVMALFSVLTGLLVLMGTLLVNRYQRAEESVLLKTLGASRATVLKILAVEYLLLGALATAAGIGLAIGAGGLLAYFVFDSAIAVAWSDLALTFVVIVALVLGLGLFNSRSLYDQSPRAVLNAEA